MDFAVGPTAGGGAAQPIVIVGLRGLGKTALLRRALRNPGSDKTSVSANWIRNQLIKKDVAYSPASGLIEFRLPLTEAFLRRNARALANRLAIPPLRA